LGLETVETGQEKGKREPLGLETVETGQEDEWSETGRVPGRTRGRPWPREREGPSAKRWEGWSEAEGLPGTLPANGTRPKRARRR